MASRQRHLLRAFEDAPVPDTLVQERLSSMRRWVRVRDAVAILLYLGVVAALGTYLAQFIPAAAGATDLLRDAAGLAGAFAGILTLGFLALTRLLGQLETDIWVLLARR